MAQSPLYYGSLLFTTAAQTTVVTGDTYVKSAGTTTPADCHGFSHSDNRLTFTGGTGRTVEVTANLSVSSSAATEALVNIFKNGEVIHPAAAAQRSTSASTDFGSVGVSVLVGMLKDDYVEVWVSSDDGAEITVEAGTVIAKVVG